MMTEVAERKVELREAECSLARAREQVAERLYAVSYYQEKLAQLEQKTGVDL